MDYFKENANHLIQVKAKTYYGLKTMARKFLKNGQVESILMHLQNTPIYYAKYKIEEGETKALNKRRKSDRSNHHRRKTCEHEEECNIGTLFWRRGNTGNNQKKKYTKVDPLFF